MMSPGLSILEIIFAEKTSTSYEFNELHNLTLAVVLYSLRCHNALHHIALVQCNRLPILSLWKRSMQIRSSLPKAQTILTITEDI